MVTYGQRIRNGSAAYHLQANNAIFLVNISTNSKVRRASFMIMKHNPPKESEIDAIRHI